MSSTRYCGLCCRRSVPGSLCPGARIPVLFASTTPSRGRCPPNESVRSSARAPLRPRDDARFWTASSHRVCARRRPAWNGRGAHAPAGRVISAGCFGVGAATETSRKSALEEGRLCGTGRAARATNVAAAAQTRVEHCSHLIWHPFPPPALPDDPRHDIVATAARERGRYLSTATARCQAPLHERPCHRVECWLISGLAIHAW
jgi:hypothetical protein